jgi:hypothetical protein
MFRSVAETSPLPASHLKMRDVMTIEDRQKLFKKLAVAISQGNTQKALLMIGRGAELDTAYYDRDFLSPSFDHDSDYLSESKYTLTIFHAAPILQAARRGNQAVIQLLKEAGASTRLTGQQYILNREITGVHRYLETTMQPILVPHYFHDQNSCGRHHRHVGYRTEFRPVLQERTSVTIQDSRSGMKNYQLDEGNHHLVEI